MAINPNDPVVSILQSAVTDFRRELDSQMAEVQEAMSMLAQGVGQHIQRLLSRITVLEDRVALLEAGRSTPLPPVTSSGVEL